MQNLVVSSKIFVSILLPSVYIVTWFTVILSLIAIFVIFIQTPAEMKSCKKYLIIFTIHSALFQVAYAIYSPTMLHPIFAVYPIGIANIFHPMVSFAIIGLTIIHSMGMLDCNTAMLMHSYYGIQRLRETTKKPLIVYMFLSGLTFAGTALGVLVVFCKPLFVLFFIPPEHVSQALKTNYNNISEIVNTKNILLFVQSTPNSMPLLLTILGGCACLRIIISFIYFCFNWNLYTGLEGEVPYDHYQKNLMFFRVAYLQFIGFGTFVGLPMLINTFLLLFVKKPTLIPTIFMIPLNFFSLFSVIILFIAVRPYRLFVIRFVKKCAGINTQVSVYATH